jgi:hypothetical protein
MLVSEPDVAALEADVAELLGILEMFPTEGGVTPKKNEMAAGISRYAEQVERIGLAAGRAGFLGLQDVCLLFQEILLDSDLCQRNLGDVERERLEEWPILVIGHLGSPTDPEASEPLLDHLRSPVWSTPLPETEVEALREVLAHGVLAAEPETLPIPEPEPESELGVTIEPEPAELEFLETAELSLKLDELPPEINGATA